jgi:DeoR family transcriptional regulator, fructose operon transcriptional repressor
MNRVLIPERWERIIDLVHDHGRASVAEIARTLGISTPTVRRDLTRIQQRGLIRRTWGGAEPSPGSLPGITLAESRRVNPGEKERIGRAAARLVERGDCVMIDGGFTTYQLARQLAASEVTLVTNSLDVAQAVAGRRDLTLVMLGGKLLAASGTTVGPTTQKQLGELFADKAFLGANAFSPDGGLCADIELTAETKKAMIRNARETIVVADHSKLGKSALYRVAPAAAIAALVTDDQADEGVLEAFRTAGVEVLVAAAAGRPERPESRDERDVSRP